MNLTNLVEKIAFRRRQKELDKYANNGLAMQQEVLHYLVEYAKDTEYGRNHLFSTIQSYDDFVQNVPVNTYAELKGDIDRMRHCE